MRAVTCYLCHGQFTYLSMVTSFRLTEIDVAKVETRYAERKKGQEHECCMLVEMNGTSELVDCMKAYAHNE